MTLLRMAKIIVALAIGLWGLVGLMGNLVGIMDVYLDVERVTSMAQVPEGEGPPWGTSNPFVVWAGVLAIVLGKAAAVICGVGGVMMVRRVSSSPEEFAQAKKLAVAGAGLAFAINFVAFTIFAESVFFMFYAGNLASVGPLAFRFTASFALATLFLMQVEPSED